MTASKNSEAPKKRGTYNRIGSSSLFNVQESVTKRQLSIPDSIYDPMKELNIDLKPIYGEVSLHDTILVVLQVGIVTLVLDVNDACQAPDQDNPAEGSTQRQLDIPNASVYDGIKRLKIKLKPTHGRLSLHDTLLLVMKCGISTLKKNPNAPRLLPAT